MRCFRGLVRFPQGIRSQSPLSPKFTRNPQIGFAQLCRNHLAPIPFLSDFGVMATHAGRVSVSQLAEQLPNKSAPEAGFVYGRLLRDVEG